MQQRKLQLPDVQQVVQGASRTILCHQTRVRQLEARTDEADQPLVPEVAEGFDLPRQVLHDKLGHGVIPIQLFDGNLVALVGAPEDLPELSRSQALHQLQVLEPDLLGLRQATLNSLAWCVKLLRRGGVATISLRLDRSCNGRSCLPDSLCLGLKRLLLLLLVLLLVLHKLMMRRMMMMLGWWRCSHRPLTPTWHCHHRWWHSWACRRGCAGRQPPSTGPCWGCWLEGLHDSCTWAGVPLICRGCSCGIFDRGDLCCWCVRLSGTTGTCRPGNWNSQRRLSQFSAGSNGSGWCC
mmetsp:Transcript_84016/g.271579  ORF Transcript_84016/g.271579 Transcript_84016/m.271579 type:complete len:294 (-) Transcript_84016:919-1800(-)